MDVSAPSPPHIIRYRYTLRTWKIIWYSFGKLQRCSSPQGGGQLQTESSYALVSSRTQSGQSRRELQSCSRIISQSLLILVTSFWFMGLCKGKVNLAQGIHYMGVSQAYFLPQDVETANSFLDLARHRGNIYENIDKVRGWICFLNIRHDTMQGM